MNQMNTHLDKTRMAERLDTIAQRIGFTLWQLQELEGAAATYYVLIAKASPGMGIDSGLEIVDGYRSKPFGTTVKALKSSEKVPSELMVRFQKLLEERNWLVHNSRSTSSSAVHDEAAFVQLIQRVDAIENQALGLLKEIPKQMEAFLLSHGFSPEVISSAAQQARNQVYR